MGRKQGSHCVVCQHETCLALRLLGQAAVTLGTAWTCIKVLVNLHYSDLAGCVC